MERYRRKIEAAGRVRAFAMLVLAVSGLLTVLISYAAFKGAHGHQVHWPGGRLIVYLLVFDVVSFLVIRSMEQSMYRWMEHADNYHDMTSLGLDDRRARRYAKVYRRYDR